MGGLLGGKLAPCAAELPALPRLTAGWAGCEGGALITKIGTLETVNRCSVSQCVMSAQSCVCEVE
jgi:hypothetical protein